MASISFAGTAAAETGMGFILDKNSKTARRVDLLDGQVAYTTPAFGSAVVSGRFSPKGDMLAYVTETPEVVVCNLAGEKQRSFAVFSQGNLSWTSSGIWVGTKGGLRLYDATTGEQLRTVTADHPNAADISYSVVSHDETVVTGRIAPPGNAIAILLDDGNRVVDFGGGCGAGPSPNGQRFTHNLWENNYEHQTMKIHNRSGTEIDYLYLYDVIPYPEGTTETERKAFSWNEQGWASNSDSIFLVPTGRGFPQMTDSVMPWIYDYDAKKAYCLHEDPYAWDVKWTIRDYFTGKNGPQPAPPAVDAGPDRTVDVGEPTLLDAAVNGDGIGADALTVTWSWVSGPAEATFDDVHAVDATVTFPKVGDYVLRLTAVDDGMTSQDDVSVTAREPVPASISIDSPQSGDLLAPGEPFTIDFSAVDIDDVTIMVSFDDKLSWEPIVGSLDRAAVGWGAFEWEVPAVESSQCWIRIAGYFGEAPRDVGPFVISATAVVDGGDAALVAGCRTVPAGTSAIFCALAVLGLACHRRRRSSSRL